LSFLLLVHQRLALAGILICLIVGIWGIFTYIRKGSTSSGYRSTLVMTEVLFVAQGLVGAILFIAGAKRPHDGLHILYGVLLLIALPIGASYTSSRDRRREPLVYGVVGLFMVGLTIRAITTGGA
jgi:heme A synthase